LPDPGTDVTQLFRNEDWFATTAEAVAELFDPAEFYATARSFERRSASRASCAPGESQAGVRSR